MVWTSPVAPDCGVRAKENRQLLILSLLTLYLPLWIPLSLQSTASNIFILYSFCPFDCYTTSPLAFQTAVATFYGSNKLSNPCFTTVSNILILFANVFQMHPLYLLPFHFFGSAVEVKKRLILLSFILVPMVITKIYKITYLAHLADWGTYLSAWNMVKWGIPEKILQNTVQARFARSVSLCVQYVNCDSHF